MKIILILLLVVAKRLDIKREEILRLYHDVGVKSPRL